MSAVSTYPHPAVWLPSRANLHNEHVNDEAAVVSNGNPHGPMIVGADQQLTEAVTPVFCTRYGRTFIRVCRKVRRQPPKPRSLSPARRAIAFVGLSASSVAAGRDPECCDFVDFCNTLTRDTASPDDARDDASLVANFHVRRF